MKKVTINFAILINVQTKKLYFMYVDNRVSVVLISESDMVH
jgi:hypothetical protein